METNEYLIRVSGKVSVEPQDLPLGKDVEFSLKGTVIEIKNLDTQDGMMDVVYVIKPTEAKIK